MTKMQNVAGISATDAQKSSDMFAKCRYMDDITAGKGVIFASGTPISNSVAEMYTVQRYLQYDALRREGLTHFDAWAANFGETISQLELAPEGTGYRQKTRFAKFFNVPELQMMYHQFADVQTKDMLKLPTPTVLNGGTKIVLPASDEQKELLAWLSERADKVRGRMVDPRVDNMLAITTDGRKLALDQRLMDNVLADSPTSKVNACAEKAFEIWQGGMAEKHTKMIFCDLSTPSSGFNVYDDLRNKLMERGIPQEEIAFIHDADTDAKKATLFSKVRSGDVRILLGSTFKMGTGTNVQTRLKAIHHLDPPWRPDQVEQRNGRGERQGNLNKEIELIYYVTEGTFDAYSYQLLENKQRFISQLRTGNLVSREMEDVDSSALTYAEIKALCASDDRIREKMELEVDVERLKTLQSGFNRQRYMHEYTVSSFPAKGSAIETRIKLFDSVIKEDQTFVSAKGDSFQIIIENKEYSERTVAGMALNELETGMGGIYHGFPFVLHKGLWADRDVVKTLHSISIETDAGNLSAELGSSGIGNITRIENLLSRLPQDVEDERHDLAKLQRAADHAKAELQKPFQFEQELREKSARLSDLNIALNLDMQHQDFSDLGDDDAPEPEVDKKKWLDVAR